MAKIKEGFKGERLVSMPEKLLEDYRKEPLIAPLYVRKIGYFPRVKYHYVQKNEGTNFRKETGVSPIHYYIRLKIQKACEYIELSDLKLSEIATRLGFEDASYFSRIFTHVMGISPSRYRTQEVARRKTTN